MPLNKAQGMTRGFVGLGVQTLMACFIRCDFPVPPHLSRESHKGIRRRRRKMQIVWPGVATRHQRSTRRGGALRGRTR